jgi:hypothetical protein
MQRPDGRMDVINELQRLGADDAIKRFRGHGIARRQIGDDRRPGAARPDVQHIAVIDVGASESPGVAVITYFEHAPTDVRTVSVEEPLNKDNVDASPSFPPIEAKHTADRRRTAQASELHSAGGRPHQEAAPLRETAL